MKWHESLKAKRLEYGVSQKNLALEIGISRVFLNRIERGIGIASDDLKKKIEFTLNRLNPENELEMLIDYVRVRFPTTDVKFVCEQILQIQLKYMISEDWGFYSYSGQYHFGDITLFTSDDESKGVLLELKGKGCRQFERFLHAQERTWYEFFKIAVNVGGVFKRVDLAINDRVGILDIPELAQKCDTEECISVFRSFKSYRSGELVNTRELDKNTMGDTLYIGSLKSEVYFCVYEKDYEQFVKNGTPIEEADVKNRFEIRLKNERAELAVVDLIKNKNPDKTAFSIINRYVRFVDKDETKERSKWQNSKRWDWFIGNNRRQLKLTTAPEPYTLERTLNWLGRQVIPSLKMVGTLDNLQGTTVLNDMVENAELTEKQLKIIVQQVSDVEELLKQKDIKEIITSGDDLQLVFS